MRAKQILKNRKKKRRASRQEKDAIELPERDSMGYDSVTEMSVAGMAGVDIGPDACGQIARGLHLIRLSGRGAPGKGQQAGVLRHRLNDGRAFDNGQERV